MIRSVFVSYDGALDPLGASQVLPYVVGLAARGVEPTLISFEKPTARADREARRAIEEHLSRAGVRWRVLAYHKRPRLPATLWDILRGAGALRSEVRRSGAMIVHCRGDVAMAMARWARLPRSVRLLYDVRGFFSDERVESGSWRRGSLLDRGVRHVEAENLARADGLVVLTEAALPALAGRRTALPPHSVIPTCVDLTTFAPRAPEEEPAFGLAYAGSLGTWYMAEEMVAFARVASQAVPGRVLFLTPQQEEARRAGATPDWAEVGTVEPSMVPRWLARARAAFFFYRPAPARKATCPTKLAEALATGLPVVANRGIGDLDALLETEGVGVLVEDFTEDAYHRAAQRLLGLLKDPETPARCRRLAETRFSLDSAVRAYHDLYRLLAGGSHVDGAF